MIGSVEDDEFDVQSGLMSGWAVTFCVLYIIVMIISIVLYLLTVRALAIEIRAHSTTYLLVMILFLTAMLEFGVVMGEFLARFGHFSFTDLNCKLLIFTRHGNRILQVIMEIVTSSYHLSLSDIHGPDHVVLQLARCLPEDHQVPAPHTPLLPPPGPGLVGEDDGDGSAAHPQHQVQQG